MLRVARYLVLLVSCWSWSLSAQAQSNDFRETRAHLWLGAGLYTYHGPIDLNRTKSSTNFTRLSDPAAVVGVSFPISQGAFYFRPLFIYSNFDTAEGASLLGQFPGGQNEFIVRNVFLFEADIMYAFGWNTRRRLLPYVFTGFGGMVAVGEAKGQQDRPGTGAPGPERTVFTLPIGIGFDYALTRMFSFFIEGSWRFDLNYVAQNEQSYNPHNTSLIMGGVRIGLANPFRRTMTIEPPPPPPIPDPLTIPPYDPPKPLEPVSRRMCQIIELNTVYYAYNSVDIDVNARARLDENIDALRLNPECCIEILGYTDAVEGSTYAVRMSQQRAEIVYQYFLSRGVAAKRMRIRAMGVGIPPCGKDEEGGPGCRRNRRVEVIPLDCRSF